MSNESSAYQDVLNREFLVRTACYSLINCKLGITYSTTSNAKPKAIKKDLFRAAANTVLEYFRDTPLRDIPHYGYDNGYALCQIDAFIESISKAMGASMVIESLCVSIPCLTREFTIASRATDHITGSNFAYELAIKVGYQDPLNLADDLAVADYASELSLSIDDPIKLWKRYVSDPSYESMLVSGLVRESKLRVDSTNKLISLFSEVRIKQPDVLFKAIVQARLMHTSIYDVISLFALVLVFGITSPFAAYLVWSQNRNQVTLDRCKTIKTYLNVARVASIHPWISLSAGSALYYAPVLLFVFALRSQLATGLIAVLVGPIAHSLF